jgi:hypothetical protein
MHLSFQQTILFFCIKSKCSFSLFYLFIFSSHLTSIIFSSYLPFHTFHNFFPSPFFSLLHSFCHIISFPYCFLLSISLFHHSFPIPFFSFILLIHSFLHTFPFHSFVSWLNNSSMPVYLVFLQVAKKYFQLANYDSRPGTEEIWVQQVWYNHDITSMLQGCNNIVMSWLYQICWNNLATSLIISTRLLQVVPNLLTTWDKQYEHNLLADLL